MRAYRFKWEACCIIEATCQDEYRVENCEARSPRLVNLMTRTMARPCSQELWKRQMLDVLLVA